MPFSSRYTSSMLVLLIGNFIKMLTLKVVLGINDTFSFTVVYTSNDIFPFTVGYSTNDTFPFTMHELQEQ